jgi:cytochrome P450
MAIVLSYDELRHDPYAVYTRLRKQMPITLVEGGTFLGSSWFVTRYDDAVALLKDVRFSNEQRKVRVGRDLAKARWIPSVVRAFLNSMVMVDDPDHTRLRTLVHKAFTPRMIQQMSQRIEEITNTLLDEVAKKPVVDLMADFALPLPLTVISDMMGVPAKDRFKFHQWTGMITETGPSSKMQLLKTVRNAFLMQRFFKGLISSRRKHPQDDLITALVQAEAQGDHLSEDELVAMLFLLLFAGHETTVNLIGNGTLALLEHLDQFEKLKANPGLLESAIEEMLRYTNPVQQIAPRYALQDVEIQGHVIPKGSTVMVGIASANRDESVFENADAFDITRDPNRHIAFGIGIHYCLGAPLARLEAKIAFQILFNRFPNIELAVPPSQLQWRASSALRGLESLPVRLKA